MTSGYFASTLAWSTETLRTVADVLLVAYLVYRGLSLIRGTRAAQMLAGLAVLIALYFLAVEFGLITLGWLLSNFLSSLIIIVVILFQEEIRRGLTKVGLQPLLRRKGDSITAKVADELSIACSKLAKQKLGALIVVQREVGLDQFHSEGATIDAVLDWRLLVALFLKDSTLHDGAAIVERGVIRAAGCVLPLSERPELDAELGTRHRAALGVSEHSDALAIVVSEQNGTISLAREGKLTQNLDPSLLRDLLYRLMRAPSSGTEDATNDTPAEKPGGEL